MIGCHWEIMILEVHLAHNAYMSLSKNCININLLCIFQFRVFTKRTLSLGKCSPNGLRYLLVGGRGFGLGAGKTRSEENARKCRRIPQIHYTLCWVVSMLTCAIVV
jgi:hypothetical protein